MMDNDRIKRLIGGRMAQTTIEILYPEFGNQAGDNGNAMYLKACLPEAEFVETAFGDEPAFASRDDISLVLLCGMTERQQERVLEELMPLRDRLLELVDAGVPMLFTGNAAELLGSMIVTPGKAAASPAGHLRFRDAPADAEALYRRRPGGFIPAPGPTLSISLASRCSFTQMEGDNASAAFCELKQGLRLQSQFDPRGFSSQQPHRDLVPGAAASRESALHPLAPRHDG